MPMPLIVLLVGLADVRLIGRRSRTSFYEEQDFYDLLSVIKSLDNLVVLPNVWTEVDDLLNNFGGNHKYNYIERITEAIKSTFERYIASLKATQSDCFFELGIT